jgi:predicted transposase YbfD/YdcC
MVSAWASENHLVLGQRRVDSKSNEITAIPELFKILAISGFVVTIDAIGTQTKIAKTIIEGDAYYFLSVKEYQGYLYEDLEKVFDYDIRQSFKDAPYEYAKTINKGHGRIEIRECWCTSEDEYLHYLRGYEKWEKLQSVVKVTCTRVSGTQETRQVRYYIASLKSDAKRFLAILRQHWGIENELLWVLDVALNEDLSRVR